MKPDTGKRGQHPPKIFTIDPWLSDHDNPVVASPEARGGRLVPWIVIRHGSLWSRIRHWGIISESLKGSLKEALESARSIRENPTEPRTVLDPQEQLDLAEYMRKLGVSGWGSTVVQPELLFAGARILYPGALVLTMEMEKSAIDTAPSAAAYKEIFRTYHELGRTVNRLARWLRERGFGAHAGPAVGGDVNYIALAQQAGLGFIGRSGLLIGPHAGPRMRLAAVYTSAQNLPSSVTEDSGQVADFCQRCGACIRACPARAIHEKPIQSGGQVPGHPVYIDYVRCAGPFSRQFGCSLCIKVCPFSKLGWQAIKARQHNLKE